MKEILDRILNRKLSEDMLTIPRHGYVGGSAGYVRGAIEASPLFQNLPDRLFAEWCLRCRELDMVEDITDVQECILLYQLAAYILTKTL